MSLPTTEDIKAFLRIDIPTEEDDDVNGVRLTVVSMVQKVTGRVWQVASGTSTRYYTPRKPGQSLIRIHDAVSVTSVSNDGETVPVFSKPTGGYQLEPVNGLDWSGEARPFEGIRYIDSYWKFDNFRATVAVTGSWGWAAIPEQVIRAHYVLSRDLWGFRDEPRAAGIEEFLEQKARTLLKGYRREEAKGGIGGPV